MLYSRASPPLKTILTARFESAIATHFLLIGIKSDKIKNKT